MHQKNHGSQELHFPYGESSAEGGEGQNGRGDPRDGSERSENREGGSNHHLRGRNGIAGGARTYLHDLAAPKRSWQLRRRRKRRSAALDQDP